MIAGDTSPGEVIVEQIENREDRHHDQLMKIGGGDDGVIKEQNKYDFFNCDT